MKKYITVLEITEQWLKLVIAKPSLKGPEIENIIIKPLASFTPDVLKEELNNILKDLKIIPYPLIICFPRNQVTVRNLHLPSRDPQEIDGMVSINLPRQVPYPKEEIISGYEILGIDEAGYTKVMLAITHRETLSRIFNLLDAAGLSAEKVELSSQGIFSWFMFMQKSIGSNNPKGLNILLDIDYNFTDFLVVSKDNLLFSRTIPHGSEQISTDAELRRNKFIYELKQSLLNFQNEETGKNPSKIFISGAIGGITDLDKLISEELSLPVEILETIRFLPRAKEIVQKIEKHLKKVSILALLGLALDSHKKRINFILPEIQLRKALKERVRQLILLGSLLIYVIIVSCFIFMDRMYNRQATSKLLDGQIKILGQDVNKLDEMSRKIKIIKERINSRGRTINYLYYIHKLTPPEIWFDTISLEETEKAVLHGQATQMSDVFKFITKLEESGYFKNIETKYTAKKKVADKDITEFEINCPMSKEAQTYGTK
jgi:Tfp pilus assembly PilM family ATPase/Tfp pilus assembly protein PilN